MTNRFFRRKHIVTTLFVTFWCSLPLGAETLDDMFDALPNADPADAARIEERIIGKWSKSGSASMDMLLQRGNEALEGEDYGAAIEHLTAAIDHDPQFAEAYHSRATAYYLAGYMGPALDDIRQALVLNPRHFGALRGFAIILEEIGRSQDALEVYHQIASIHPHMLGVAPAIERLEHQLQGEPL